MEKATLTSKGQLTVPKQVRDRLGLEPGDRLLFEIEDESIRLRVVRHRSIDELFASLPGVHGSYPGKEAEREAARKQIAAELLGEQA